MKPMLAGKYDPAKLFYPCAIQPKLDGIRCLVRNGQGWSRTLKLIPNAHIQDFLGSHTELEGFDGELIVGPVTAPDVYRASMSGIMSQGGTPKFTYHVFDTWANPSVGFKERHDIMVMIVGRSVLCGDSRICCVETHTVQNEEELLAKEALYLAQGYEGAIIRGLNQPYKQGRSTANEGGLLKLKRFEDAEAQVVGFDELMSNQNEATIDKLGHTARSSHKAGKVAAGTLGALRVKLSDGREFGIGTGFDLATRLEIWDNQSNYLGKFAKYRYVTVGGYDLPRFPVFLGWRDPKDM